MEERRGTWGTWESWKGLARSRSRGERRRNGMERKVRE